MLIFLFHISLSLSWSWWYKKVYAQDSWLCWGYKKGAKVSAPFLLSQLWKKKDGLQLPCFMCVLAVAVSILVQVFGIQRLVFLQK